MKKEKRIFKSKKNNFEKIDDKLPSVSKLSKENTTSFYAASPLEATTDTADKTDVEATMSSMQNSTASTFSSSQMLFNKFKLNHPLHQPIKQHKQQLKSILKLSNNLKIAANSVRNRMGWSYFSLITEFLNIPFRNKTLVK